MRAVALVANEEPEFHWAGLAFIAGLYIATLLPGAVALAYSTAGWPWIPFGGGVAFLAYGAVVIGGAETANAQNMTAWRWVLLFSLLTAMLAVYAAQVVLVYRSSRRGRTSRTRSVA
jgi:hypothetical protein